MFRKIIRIDEEKCNGCGACARACHEGAIAMVDGKAKLMREDYCDGLGDCLPACPTGAISFEMREAPAYDEAAVLAAKKRQGGVPHVCPGAKTGFIRRDEETADGTVASSCLSQWPVQIKLAPINAPWFAGADLLVAADCTAFAYGNFHADFIRGRITLVGCPKLDGVDYAGKLAQILAGNDVRSITVARMEVPCCGGLESAVRRALEMSGKDIPLTVSVISTDGKLLDGGR
ncbi:MAG TPA: 4Fe-4S binding protein [Candidatus Pullichristensenella stercorigallinarum]|uniref:4Fe-4S binding protein n=1 Tax=Candidatus Pullichristensenella stercorigallinarum TaxID=2840909 RepID=A0A9D1CX02_9FIRM|nr:4Fe-4S binding protein [Candidatus Pullichristensenella stercorigallinarum]